MRLLIVLTGLILSSCSDPNAALKSQRIQGAIIVRICADGTFIYRLRDGSFVTGGWGEQPVESPETVCQSK
jgi:hypothetical protein